MLWRNLAVLLGRQSAPAPLNKARAPRPGGAAESLATVQMPAVQLDQLTEACWFDLEPAQVARLRPAIEEPPTPGRFDLQAPPVQPRMPALQIQRQGVPPSQARASRIQYATGPFLHLLSLAGGCSGAFVRMPPEVRTWHMETNTTAHLELEVDGLVTDIGNASEHLRDAGAALLPQCGGDVQAIGVTVINGKVPIPPLKNNATDDQERERPKPVSRVEGTVACSSSPPAAPVIRTAEGPHA